MRKFQTVTVSEQVNELKKEYGRIGLDEKTWFELIFSSYFHDFEGISDLGVRGVKARDATLKCWSGYVQYSDEGLCTVLPVPIGDGKFSVQTEFLQKFAVPRKENGWGMAFLAEMFKSPESINSCMFAPDAMMEGSSFAYDTFPGLNFEDVREFYSQILILEKFQSNFKKNITESLEVTSKKILENFMKDPNQNPFNLRLIVILINYHGLMDFESSQIIDALCKAISHLSESNREILARWFCESPKDMLLQNIAVIQNFLTLQIYSRYIIDDKIMHGVQFLDILYEANRMRIPDSNQIPVNEFYNDPINNIVNLKEDTFKWVELSHQGVKKARNFATFSFVQYPFLLEPASKRDILKFYAQRQQMMIYSTTLFQGILSGQIQSPVLQLRINRDHLIDTAFNAIEKERKNLKRPLQVKFDGEPGVDEGGLTSEFFLLIVRAVFDVSFGMFNYDEDSRTYWFNPHSFAGKDSFNLVGTVIGLALFNSTILDLHFPFVVYKKLLGEPILLEDLEIADPTLGKGLRHLLEYEGNVEEDLCLTFTVESNMFDESREIELIPNGKNVPVTNSNRLDYVDKLIDWKYNTSIQEQYEAFEKGFQSVIDPFLLTIFSPQELELLVCGSKDLDFEALEKSTQYDGYSKDDQMIKWFWEIIHSYSIEEKKKFLSFATGSDRSPIRGLKELNFVIHRTADDEKLPSAMTCYNTLILPEYASKETLKEKLDLILEHGSGFGLK